ncbi:MAG TPA: hypothetical protein VFH93_14710 [Thermoleophilia bacterium]|nr:hypothetical protein [Thermoleophilia bacterium]
MIVHSATVTSWPTPSTMGSETATELTRERRTVVSATTMLEYMQPG